MAESPGENPLVLIPAHNEAQNLPALIEEVRDQCPGMGVLVVDDGSGDGTPELLSRLGVRWIRLPRARGVGGAVRAGLAEALRLGHHTVVRLDGDGQHQAGQAKELLRAITESGADAAVGSRYRAASGYRSTGTRRLVQRALATMLAATIKEEVTDPTSGFWAFGPRAVTFLADRHPAGYAEPRLRLLLHSEGLRVVEVPATMRERRNGRSSLSLVKGGLAIAAACLAIAAHRDATKCRSRQR
jgi:glycosyltransferase involved in cell wall biosynthesis